MEYSVIFFGKITELCSKVIERIESNEENVCFVIDNAMEYNQVLGQYVETGKVLTVFTDLKSMSDSAAAGRDYFKSNNHHGLLVSGARPMHPLITNPKSNIKFFNSDAGEDKLVNKIEAFLQLGVFVKDKDEEAKIKEMDELRSKFRSENSVIDTTSVQRVERLGFAAGDEVERTNRDKEVRQGQERSINYSDFTMDRSEKKQPADIDMFSRQLASNKDSGFSRLVDQYREDCEPDKYTDEWIEKDPENVEELLEEEEHFYAPDEGLSKYLSLFAEMLGKETFSKEVLYKLIKMVLGKQHGCEVSFFRIEEGKVYDDEAQGEPEDLGAAEDFVLNTPSWRDETYTDESYQFTMPYYTNGKCYGVAKAVFSNVKLNHDEAAKIECVFALAKGVFRP
ncbi:MAG: hypothetical protein CME64_17300 [Halobacteriovoraceae bacterium]|nr:hypothetical protein [Halobacteriovoraceae bacterium]